MKRWRFLSVIAVAMALATSSGILLAQDPGALAAQQAAQQAAAEAQRANDRAIQDARDANQRAMQQAQQNTTNTNNAPAISYTAAPSFSVKSGVVSKGTVVRLKSRTHYAAIYYTTDGWTPTTDSQRYTGPITVDSTMKIQAIAIAPDAVRSLVASATYTGPGTVAPAPEPLATDGVLREGTLLRLVTSAAVNSKTAQIGDTLHLVLDQDVKVGEEIVVPRGTPVEATITQADPAGAGGMPGDLVFEIHSLTAGGRTITLRGGATLEGPNHAGRAISVLMVPVVGVAGLAIHGGEAEIKPGMTVVASVAGDTALQPVQP